METKLNEERKSYEKKINDEKLKIDACKTELTTYKAAMDQEIKNMNNKLSLMLPFSAASFSDSAILKT